MDRLREELLEQRIRLHELTDYGRFEDLPKALRNEEIFRTKGHISTLEGLLLRAGEPVEAPADAEAQALLADIEAAREKMDEAYRSARSAEQTHGGELRHPVFEGLIEG